MQKYTPTTISDIVFESSAEKNNIQRFINNPVQFFNFGISGILLHGITGTGKTASSAVIPGAIEASLPNGVSNPYTLKYKCTPGNNGVDLIQSIQTYLSTTSLAQGSGLRYIVLDEVDNLTPSALTQLKSVMSMPDVVFIMTTNHINKLEPALRDRCQEISFNPTDPVIWLPRMKQVLALEGITGSYSDGFLMSLVTQASFSARGIFKRLLAFVDSQKQKAQQQSPAVPANANSPRPTMSVPLQIQQTVPPSQP